MSDASQVFTLNLPAGNGLVTPVLYPTQIPTADVDRCLITWAAGCVGLVGIALYSAGSPAFPNQANTWLAFDDYTYSFNIDNKIQTGNWGVMAYNSDYFVHTIQVVLEYSYIQLTSGPQSSLQVAI